MRRNILPCYPCFFGAEPHHAQPEATRETRHFHYFVKPRLQLTMEMPSVWSLFTLFILNIIAYIDRASQGEQGRAFSCSNWPGRRGDTVKTLSPQQPRQQRPSNTLPEPADPYILVALSQESKIELSINRCNHSSRSPWSRIWTHLPAAEAQPKGLPPEDSAEGSVRRITH